MKKKITASCLSLALALGLFSTAALAAEEPNVTADTDGAVVQSQEAAEPMPAAEESCVTEVEITSDQTSYTISKPTKLIVSGDITLNGVDDAFTINADTELVFEDGATLTLSGYTNGFVVSDATITSANMSITASSPMDVFRLKTNGKLLLSGNSTITGNAEEVATNRALVLESGEGQAITLAENTTLTASKFYRGLETGGAKNYVISGAGMDSSTFNFQGNTVGMALSYFDEDANYEDCKLDVSNCVENGIFMRQDNAAIWGLYFDGVNIHCVNDKNTSKIAIRFHAGPFRFDNSVMTIDGSTTTGLWIYDGWDATRTGSGIFNSEITVKNVTDNILRKQGKAITMAICHEWTIDGSTINVDKCGYAGINLSNDTRVSGSIFSGYTAVPGMVGGKLIITDSDIHSSDMEEINLEKETGSALFTVQVGQFLEFGDDVTAYNDNPKRPIVICAKGTDPYPYYIRDLIPTEVEYNLDELAEELNTDQRFIMTGGSSKDQAQEYDSEHKLESRNIPINEAGVALSIYELTEAEYNEKKNPDGSLTITTNGESYTYHANRTADDGVRYIWVPAEAVIGGGM